MHLLSLVLYYIYIPINDLIFFFEILCQEQLTPSPISKRNRWGWRQSHQGQAWQGHSRDGLVTGKRWLCCRFKASNIRIPFTVQVLFQNNIYHLSIYLPSYQSINQTNQINQSRIFNEYSIFFHRNAFQQRHLTLINHAFNSCLAQKTCLNMASIGLPYAAATKLDFIWSISCKFL